MRKAILIVLLIFLPTLLYAGDWIQVDGGVTELDLNQKELETELWKHLNKHSKYKFQPKIKYTYQYQVQKGNVLYINAFCDNPSQKELSKYFVVVKDGGSCFFQVKFNLEKGKFFGLNVNGEA